MFLPTDSLGNVTTLEDGFTLSTGSYDRAASSLGLFTAGDKELLKPFGTEGSAATISNLQSGTYSFDWSMYSKDKNGWDKLYAWNGKDLILVGDRSTGNQISSARWTHDSTIETIDVIYDYVTFIALDENSKTGTTEFTINNFDYLAELPYESPTQIDLQPDLLLGDIDIKDGYTSIGTGGGDRALSTLSSELGIDLSGMGTEGSLATWNLENGVYEVTWKIYQTEDQRDRDQVMLWDGNQLEFFADGSQSVQTSATRYQTDWVTTEVEVTNGELTFVALDEIDKSGTTQLRIRDIQKTSDIEVLEFDTVPEDDMGAINGSSLSTGAGAVSSEVLKSDFFHDSQNVNWYGTEGTAALWTTEPGLQRIIWSVETEEYFDPDQFLLWDGQGFKQLGNSAIADDYNPETGFKESGLMVSTVETFSDEWGIVALDSGDTLADSIITIHEIKWLSDGEADELYYPRLDPNFNDPDDEPLISLQEQGYYEVGGFWDERDLYKIPLGYNEGVEGTISVEWGDSSLIMDVYDSVGELYDSYYIDEGSPVGFSFGSDTFTLEIYPEDVELETGYSLSFDVGQVYDPF